MVSSFVEPLLVNIIKNGTCRLSFGEVENTPGKISDIRRSKQKYCILRIFGMTFFCSSNAFSIVPD